MCLWQAMELGGRFTIILIAVMWCELVQCQAQTSALSIPLVEVFIDETRLVIKQSEAESGRIMVYRLYGIERFQQYLSDGLPADPERARRLVMSRLKALDARQVSMLERSAQGLVQAMQYGLDRYPAVVFDGQAVVYGLTDIKAARNLYQQWLHGTAE